MQITTHVMKYFSLLFVWASLLLSNQILFAKAASVQIKIPSDDDFYDPPAGFEDKKEGDILKWRVSPYQLETILFPVNLKKVWQVLVRSSDSHGNPTAIMTTIMEPYNADSSKLVSYQAAQDSSTEDCAPSYAYLHSSSLVTLSTKAEMFLINTMLEEGYFVVSPDYEGPKGTFTAGRQAGKATLDSIRATLKSSNITGVNSDADVIMWGYSGGTIASGWAAALQPSYAPELKPRFLGVAVGGWVTNITATVEIVEGTVFAGLSNAGMHGLSNEYPELVGLYKDNMSPEKFQEFNEGEDLCLLPVALKYLFTSFFTGNDRYFTKGWDVFKNDTLVNILNENTLGLKKNVEVPEIPMFVFHGTLDRIVPFKEAQRTYEVFCDSGINSLEFAVDQTAGHISEVATGSPAAIAWIKGRFNGNEPVSGCQRTERLTNTLYPGSDAGIASVIEAALVATFGFNIGPNGENINASALQHVINDGP